MLDASVAVLGFVRFVCFVGGACSHRWMTLSNQNEFDETNRESWSFAARPNFCQWDEKELVDL